MKKKRIDLVELNAALNAPLDALNDATRRELLLTLAAGERNVTGLCEALERPQPTISHHLGLLRMHGLVEDRRVGKLVYYSLAPACAKLVSNLRAFAGAISGNDHA